METKFNAALKRCGQCTTYQELCDCFDATVRPLLEGLLRTALVKPVRDHVSPAECSPQVSQLREMLENMNAGDDLWFFLYRAAATFLERSAKKRTRDGNVDMSTFVVNVFVLFYGHVPPKLSSLHLQWGFLRKEKSQYESSESYVHSNAAERRKALMTSVLSVFSERAHRHYFTGLWMPCLHHAAAASLHLHLLHRMGDVILPYLTNPLVVADYLSGCFASGGLVAVLALHGIFLLVLDHGLEYPQYYQQLYTLLTPDAFSSRHRYDLFRLLDLSLSSIRVPSYVAAAFIKKVARVAMLSPSPVLYFVLPFIRKVLQRHPNCLALIHRSTKEAVIPEDDKDTVKGTAGVSEDAKKEALRLTATLFDGNDPFLPDESLERCHALHSTLWELTALERHFIPTVPLMVSAFASTAEDQAPLRFEKTYARLFTAEVTRPMSNAQLPTVAYREPEEDSTDAILLV
ncbi:U3 small nucleolar RNA-associated protein 19 [Trypanosoma theileri]|uniref:U3 small nucleolar RNA-associated protein 19 n=1 Tax=Trypanosoma theileri TaxID=67003 RepID=A0A1X0P9H6_9TRYP|nr:U3 small nucleolar RNA-associated protein 19 [Trypanosoma theileri]ORC93485.1 U3 small nucleolar RNA-associated protein 19 [Trypanosoma theileri]